MNRKFIKIIFAVVFLSLLLTAGMWAKKRYFSAKRAEGYNVILLSLDTTRADFLGCYGNSVVSTPNLDGLAKKGVLFENFYSTLNTTLGSHCSMFTGLYPRNHGVGRNAMRLDGRNLTLAEFLSAKGYSTGAFIGSFALASVFGVDQGFKTFDESFLGNADDLVQSTRVLNNSQDVPMEFVFQKPKVGRIVRSAEQVNQSFFDWLQGSKKGKFFAFIHYYDAHFPYKPAEEWYKKHLQTIPPQTPLTIEDRELYDDHIFRELAVLGQPFKPNDIGKAQYAPEVDALLKLYLSQIEYVDHNIGELVARLKQEGVWSRTILIVTADHGENLIEHPEFDTFFRHGYLTHQSETHVPFIVTCPGVIPEGRRVKGSFSSVDIYPTVADILGFKNPVNTDGISILNDLFIDIDHKDRMIFSEATQPSIDVKKDASRYIWINDPNGASVWGKDYKYTVQPYKGFEGMFKLSDDPLENHSLDSGSDHDVFAQLRAALGKWRSTAKAGAVDTDFHLSDEDRQKIESLGYVQ